MNISSLILDHYDMLDSGELTADALKEAMTAHSGRLMSAHERARQVDNDFGLVMIASHGAKIRRYPLNTPFETYMSKVSAVMNDRKLPVSARHILNDRLSAACERYRLPIRKDFIKRADRFVPSSIYVLTPEDEATMEIDDMAKKASSDYFAITESIEGTPMHKYPLDTPEQIQRRIEKFETNHNSMHIKYAFQFVDNVYKRAKELGLKIPADSMLMLYKESRLNPDYKQYLQARIEVAPEELQLPYMGLMLKQASASPRQIAVAIDSLDKSCGMEMLYGKDFPDPANSALTLQKEARVIAVGTLEIDLDKLTDDLEAHPEEYASFLDKDVLDQLKADPETIFKSLPLPHRQMILETLGGNAS